MAEMAEKHWSPPINKQVKSIPLEWFERSMFIYHQHHHKISKTMTGMAATTLVAAKQQARSKQQTQ